jgi:non-homologous end joining protein Ku
MARAMWRASLRLGDFRLPVKLYAAVEDRSVHFRLLHVADRVPVAQRMVDPATPEVSNSERELAEKLVSALDGPFDPAMLRDEHRDRVLALIEAKAKGRPVRKAQAPPPRPTSDLTRALRASLRAAREGRVA